MSNIYASNIVSHKYDTALDFHVTMYDNLPYQRDSDYCNKEKLALVSGRVIKFYLYMCQPEKFLINNKDDEIEEILARIQAARTKPGSTHKVHKLSSESDSGVTQEQIQTLLEDATDKTSEPEPEDNSIDAPLNSVNAFANVEDW